MALVAAVFGAGWCLGLGLASAAFRAGGVFGAGLVLAAGAWAGSLRVTVFFFGGWVCLAVAFLEAGVLSWEPLAAGAEALSTIEIRIIRSRTIKRMD